MPWWGWVLVAWPVVALVVAVVLGRLIRMADRRDLKGDRPDEDPPSEEGTGGGGQRTPR
ncbi:hypothetical protein SAMN05660690_1191 [Geodermatophilus telluris]|uniref:Uncharacterized protein n=1 Tax=Geodermatophilus telluris TaxID=1190417 RepID=A0A1G6L4M0_9ACTN|nr:hypothetical protein [Geodermatophilus telluris]SDC38071.1 hypothetical protein SAMN05660690_1191 [Geodermatophilus telluris]